MGLHACVSLPCYVYHICGLAIALNLEGKSCGLNNQRTVGPGAMASRMWLHTGTVAPWLSFVFSISSACRRFLCGCGVSTKRLSPLSSQDDVCLSPAGRIRHIKPVCERLHYSLCPLSVVFRTFQIQWYRLHQETNKQATKQKQNKNKKTATKQ